MHKKNLLVRTLFIINILVLLLAAYFAVQIYKVNTAQSNELMTSIHQFSDQIKILAKKPHLSPQQLEEQILNLPDNETFYAYIVNDKDSILAAPDSTLIGQPITKLNDISNNLSNKIHTFNLAENQDKAEILTKTDVTLTTLSLTKVNNLVVVVIRNHLSTGYYAYLKAKSHLLFAFITLLGLSIILYWFHFTLRKQVNHTKHFIVISLLAGITILALIVTLIMYRTPEDIPTSAKPLYNLSQVHNYLDETTNKIGSEKAILLPFGVYITNLDFNSTNSVKLSLWLWSKKTMLKNNDVQIILPQKNIGTIEAIQNKQDEVLTRYNLLELRQVYSQVRYPFDDRYVMVEFWHSDVFNPNIILYPDLSSYNLIDKNNFFTNELDPSVSIKDWDVIKSFYIALPFKVGASLGYNPEVIQKIPHRVVLMTLLRRDITAPLMKYYLPLLIVLMMYFIGLLMSQREKNIFWILTYNASLLFVITVAANNAREQIAINKISFIEVSYIIVYIVIVLFSLAQFMKAYIVENKAELLSMLLQIGYWPIILTAMLINTLCYFW